MPSQLHSRIRGQIAVLGIFGFFEFRREVRRRPVEMLQRRNQLTGKILFHGVQKPPIWTKRMQGCKDALMGERQYT